MPQHTACRSTLRCESLAPERHCQKMTFLTVGLANFSGPGKSKFHIRPSGLISQLRCSFNHMHQ